LRNRDKIKSIHAHLCRTFGTIDEVEKMLMSCENVESLCLTMSRSIASASKVLHSSLIPEILDRLWNIQDHLNRLVDVASDCPEVVFWSLQEDHPGLQDDLRDLLTRTCKGALAQNPAARACCEMIEHLLLKLESYRLPAAEKAFAASASIA
jgi:hypothetical protein